MSMLYLLDKNIARKSVRALVRIGSGLVLTDEQTAVLRFLQSSGELGHRLFIAPESYNILTFHFANRVETHAFLRQVEVLAPTRYCKRWSRRLCSFGFTPEDAWELALGTFSTAESIEILGVHVIVTLDQPMVSLFSQERVNIRARLMAMTANLASPWSAAVLPDVESLSSIQVGNCGDERRSK